MKCPRCGQEKKLVTGDRVFCFNDDIKFVVSGLGEEGMYECGCGIDLNESTKKLLYDLDNWKGEINDLG